MKCNQTRPGFELVSPCPFPMTITGTFKSSGLLNRRKRVRIPVALFGSLSVKYPWERYEPSYPPSYGLNSTTTVLAYGIKQRKQTNFLLVLLSQADISSCLSNQRTLPFFLVVEVPQALEVNNGSEQVIIRGSQIRTICWMWHQFDSLKFLGFIPDISTYANIAKLTILKNTKIDLI